MNLFKIASTVLKIIVAIPAIVEVGKAGAAAGRSIIDAVKRKP